MPRNDNVMVESNRHTIAFLRMAAIEMRRLADHGASSAGDAAQLRHMADKCDQDAAALSQRVTASEPGTKEKARLFGRA